MADAPEQDVDPIGDTPYRAMVQHLSDVILLLDRETGLTRYVSPSVETVFGYRPGALLGRDPFALIHPEDRDRQWRHFLLVRQSRGVPPADVFRFADAQGNWRRVETVASTLGDRPEVIVAMRDVTRRVEAERELAARNDRFKTLADLAPVAIFEMDADGAFVFANEQLRTLLGALPSGDLNEIWPTAIHPDDVDRVLQAWEEVQANPRRYEVQLRLAAPDGTTHQHLSRVDPVFDGEGGLTGWIGTSEDVTGLYEMVAAAEEQASLLEHANLELRASQAAAAQANRAKSEFLSRMSHELRTPLNSIIGFAQLLEQGNLDFLGHDEAVALIHSSGRHLLSLVEEVLDISRIETGGLSLSLEPVDLGHLVDDAVQVLRPEGAQHEVNLLIERADNVVYVRADRQRLLQVLLNLLSNAIRYNHRGGWVELRYQPDATAVRLSVGDSGRGIAQEHLARLFDPFERLDADSMGVSGTGLGLTVSKALLEQMGATLEVVSTVGTGTAFTITLPRAVAEEHRADEARPQPLTAATSAAAPVPGDERTVLYIEDNPVNFRLVERCLQARPSLRVIGATSGLDGLALARSEQPDLILLDLHLPDLSGFEVLAELRADPTTADVPVTVLTADATPGLRQQVTSDDRTAYLTKPLQLGDLLASVDRATVRR